ncbi:hypothetical protein QBC35DRAFT_515721 [Podospora australis]|uniref:Uncharacterized protein n=1 Tax=Podospora australis TaxID=1536484 RepID=A0AAN7AHS0_9PEZI|nr:hypothetical protein QBC35DRAFT_515721 [Podospora australis]
MKRPSGALGQIPAQQPKRSVAKVVSWFETFQGSGPPPLSPPDTVRNIARQDRDYDLQHTIQQDVERSFEQSRDVIVDERPEPDSESEEDQDEQEVDPTSQRRIAGIRQRLKALGKIDYGGLGPIDDDYDKESTSSDWDNYKTTPLLIGEYEEVAHRLEGYDDWNEDQRRLHRLIYMRGLHPMIPSNWRLSFRTWGINEPHLDDVFTPEGSEKRTVIHHYNGLHAAGKALESLFFLTQYVTDYEETGLLHKASALIARTLRNYIKWSMKDAGLDYKINLPTIIVRQYRANFVGEEEMDVDSNDVPDDRSVTDLSESYSISEVAGEAPEANHQRRFLTAMSNDLEKRMRDLGRNWRLLLKKENGEQTAAAEQPAEGRRSRRASYITAPPTLYAYAIIQHMIIIVSYDSGSPKSPVVTLETVSLNDRGLWLWNALSLAIPANMARDALYDMRDTGFIVPEQPDESDPDL